LRKESAAITAIFFTVLACAFSGKAVAWGPTGHQLIGDIAEARLTRHARKEVSRLLRDDLDAEGKPSGRKTLGAIATWADDYRRTPAGASTAPWHYNNWPICGSQEMPPCVDGACASRALERQITVLGDQNASARERNEALKWVVHLMGDIHQPLHEADNSDRGGNLVKVTFFGITQDEWGPLNLHGVWDTYLVERWVAQTPGGVKAIVRREGKAVMHSEWESGSIADWVAESHRLGVSQTYAQLPMLQPCNQPTPEILQLGEHYYAGAAPVVDLQLRKAGVRLAKILNETLAR